MPLRILHLVTSLNGGAGIAAQRLEALQNDFGSKAFLLGPRRVEKKIYHSVVSKAITYFQMKIATSKYQIVTPISLPSIKITEIDNLKPDIVHIHNWYNLIDESLIVELSRKYPLVFTLHDQRLLTGGCHNSFDCQKYNSGCEDCPATRIFGSLVSNSFQNLSNCFKKIERYSLIAPSQWMVGLALESGRFQNATSLAHITNALDTSISQTSISKKLGPELRILFVSAQLDINIKGLNTLLVALKELSAIHPVIKPRIILTLVGDSSRTYEGHFGNLEIKQFARLDSKDIEAQMQLSDLLIVPSLSENSPNVVGEAQLCGLIVAGAKVGGIPELIRHSETGFLFIPDVEGTKEIILNFVKLNQGEVDKIRLNAQKDARFRYDKAEIYRKTNDIYHKLLDESYV